MYHVSESLSRGTVTLTFPPYLTVAYLVLQNYVADYISVPCFGKSVKWTCSEPVRSMNGLHDQKSLHETCLSGFARERGRMHRSRERAYRLFLPFCYGHPSLGL